MSTDIEEIYIQLCGIRAAIKRVGLAAYHIDRGASPMSEALELIADYTMTNTLSSMSAFIDTMINKAQAGKESA